MTPEQLRASILQYAMEGKLVKQDPNDEPASELLKKIENEKAELIKKGKISKERAVRPVKEDEKDSALPAGWTYTRFQNISLFTTDYVANGSFKTLREHTHKYKEKNYALFVRTMDLSANFKTNLTYIDEDSYNFLSKSKLFGGELILPNIGGSIGKAFLMPNLNIPMSLAPNSIMVKFTEPVMNKYFSYFIQSPTGKSLLLNNKGGTATPKFSKTELRNMVLKLPPLEEQKRIVAKIEKLMPLVNEYAESYNRLQKIDNEFEDKLKQSILQFAIEGKIVSQDSDDEPASLLLEKIKAEKEQLIKEKKIKKSKALPPITDDEKPFDIPDSWEWVRLEDISTFMNGFAYKSKLYVRSASNQVIRLGNVKNDHLILDNKQVFIDDKYADNTANYKIREGNILFTMTGTRKKRDYFFSLLVNKRDVSKKNLYLNQRVGCLNHIFGVDKKWLNYILKSQTVLDEVFINETGTANQGNIGSTKTMRIVLPLPPLEEQKRIVSKIEKLFEEIEKNKR